jgi:3-dehydroquinate dehydratase
LAKLLVGFSDVDGDNLTVANLTANHGTVAINNGVYTFTPTANYDGDVKFGYDVIDGHGGTVAANSTFNLAAVNDAPIGTATASLTNGTEDTVYAIDLAKLLVGFSDVDGDILTVANLTANRGTIFINNGVYTFTPTANYNGDVKFSYDVIDGHGGTVAANSTFNGHS